MRRANRSGFDPQGRAVFLPWILQGEYGFLRLRRDQLEAPEILGQLFEFLTEPLKALRVFSKKTNKILYSLLRICDYILTRSIRSFNQQNKNLTGVSDMTSKKSYYTTRAEVVSSRENPWARELAHTIKKGGRVTGFASSSHALVNTNTGETAGDMAVIGIQKVVDKEEFVKFFGAGIEEVFDLTKPSKDLFRAILKAYLDAKNQPDQLYINFDVMRDDFGYDKSRPTFNNGLNELCVKGFLAPVERRENLYWVNPHLFYKGDRIRLVREYVRNGSNAHKQLEKEQAAMQQQMLPLDSE